jgi:23S rRNA (adenine2030-N6)-methyltransferase
MLIASALRERDRFVACELRPREHEALADMLSAVPGATALHADGFDVAAGRAGGGGATFVLIDPPYERGDDYRRVVDACAAVLGQEARATILVWLPLKDLETFDRFLRGLEEIEPREALVVECRLRPLDNPMAMNGCALLLINPPPGVVGPVGAANDWIVRACGDVGGQARLWTL